jgi:hypothetical protein
MTRMLLVTTHLVQKLPSSLCMKYKYKFMFLCLIIPSSEAPCPRLNMMLKPLIEKLKQLWIVVEAYDCYKKLCTCGRSMILRHTTFLLVGLFTENWHVRYVVQTRIVFT